METAPSTAVKLVAASAPLGSLLIDTCDVVEAHPVQRAVSLLGGDPLTFDAPSMCGLTLRFTGPLVYDAVTDAGQARLSLTMPLLALRAHDGAIPVGGSLALELGDADWLTPEDVREGAAAATASRLALALREGASLYVDVDGDGWLDADERSAGAVAIPTDTDDGASADERAALGVAADVAVGVRASGERAGDADAASDETGGTDAEPTDAADTAAETDAPDTEDAPDTDDADTDDADTDDADTDDADTDDADTDDADTDDAADTGAAADTGDAADTDDTDTSDDDTDDTDTSGDRGASEGASRSSDDGDPEKPKRGNNGRGMNLTPGVPRGPRGH